MGAKAGVLKRSGKNGVLPQRYKTRLRKHGYIHRAAKIKTQKPGWKKGGAKRMCKRGLHNGGTKTAA